MNFIPFITLILNTVYKIGDAFKHNFGVGNFKQQHTEKQEFVLSLVKQIKER